MMKKVYESPLLGELCSEEILSEINGVMTASAGDVTADGSDFGADPNDVAVTGFSW